MAESEIFKGRYLTYDSEVLQRNYGVYERKTFIRNGVEVSIYDSDPFWLAVISLNSKPVVIENSIVDYEKWLERLRTDDDFLNHVESL